MAVYEKWQSERYSIGCKIWEARCSNCHELVESADSISSNYRFCPYCGFDMKSDFQRVADRRQFTECLMKLKEAKRLLKAAVPIINNTFPETGSCWGCANHDEANDECKGGAFAQCSEVCKWEHADEALALIGEDGDTNG